MSNFNTGKSHKEDSEEGQKSTKVKRSYHIDEHMAHGLKVLAAKEEKYQSDMLTEALQDLFEKYDHDWT